jgi:hypothetical protein
LEYTCIPNAQVDNISTSHDWNNGLEQSTSLSELLKDAPTSSKSNATVEIPFNEEQADDIPATSTPMEVTSPGVPIMSHGGDTPNSMAVERATEPSLRSYSPTSSIRAPSDADYSESPPALNFVHQQRSMSPEPSQQFHYPMESPMTESVATLIDTDSPKSISAIEPPTSSATVSVGFEKPWTGPGDDYVISSAMSEVTTTGSGLQPPGDLPESSAKSEVNGGSAATGKVFLAKGKIDPKAQDDFIAFMMGMK